MTVDAEGADQGLSQSDINFEVSREGTTITPTPDGEDNGTYYYLLSGSFVVSGDYSARINFSGDTSDYQNFTLDTEGPTVNPKLNSESPKDYINDDSPTVRVEASDDVSSVEEVELSVTGDDFDESTSSDGDSAEIDLSDVSDGTYDVGYTVTDSVGNTNSDSWSFTVDTQYRGDTDPEISPGPQVFRVDNDDPMRVQVRLEGTEDERSEIRTICSYQGGEIYTSDYEDVPESGSKSYYCELDPGSYVDMALDFSVELEDEAGNSWTNTVGQYVFDFTRPEIGNLSAVVGVFNSDFEVSYEASDNGEELSVQKIHYQIGDEELDLSSGTNVSEVDGDFKVDTEGLSKGEHTVYAWAVDEAGRVSEASAFEFNFKPDAEPEVALGSVDSVSVAAGNSQTVSVNVTNTGELFVGSMELSLNSDIRNSSRTLNDLKPGEMENGLFSVDTSSDDLGAHTLKFSTESPDSSRSVRFVVEANSEQEKRIESDYSEYLSKYNELKENVSDLKSSGLSSSRQETLDSNTSEFFSSMESAKRAKEGGDLYLVEKHMSDISRDFETASSTFEEVQRQHQRSERNETYVMIFLLFVGIGGSGLAYITFFSEQYELNMEALGDIEFLEGPVQTVQTTLDQYEITLEPLENAVERVGELLAEEEKEIEEAEEQAFQGFT